MKTVSWRHAARPFSLLVGCSRGRLPLVIDAMSWLFTITLLAASVGVAVTTRTMQRLKATVTRRGPVPGYSWTPGGNVDLGDLTRGYGVVRWTIERLEEFHSADRTRVILTLNVEGDAEHVRDALLEVAKRLRTRISVDVVMVEADGLRLLYAPDGKGWSGGGEDDVLFSEAP